MKISIDNLVLEVTRKCNMNCEHCMRGDAQNCDIKCEYIDAILEHTEGIHSITFTGGEPTLNLDAIEYTLNKVKELEIPVSSFYLVTNGKEVSDRFLMLMLQWYTYTCQFGEPEFCGVALSVDKFHENIPYENQQKLRAFSFFSDTDKRVDWDKTPLIALGRGVDHYNTRARVLPSLDADFCNGIYYINQDLCVTSDGYLLPVCDYEYEEVEDIAVGHVNDMKTFEETLKEVSGQAAEPITKIA